jgi:hypothetical protein
LQARKERKTPRFEYATATSKHAMQSMLPHRFSRSSSLALITLVILACLTLSRLHSVSYRFEAAFFHRHDQTSAASASASDEPYGTHHRPPLSKPVLAPGQCIPELEYLKKSELGLSESIVLTRRCVRPIWSTRVDRDEVANITRPLFMHKLPVNLSSCSHVDFVPCDHLTLRVPPPYPEKRYPQFLFGVATSSGRLADSLAPFAHWLSGSGAKLFAVVTDAAYDSTVNIAELESLFAAQDIDATFVKPHNDSLSVSELHFTMIHDLLNQTTLKTKWIGILDDDTFFPSLYTLSQELAKFDHKVPAYLGALSEDFRAIMSFGFMAFGGAGVFLTVPLAEELDPYIDRCLEEASIAEGDTILRDCIYAHTHTKLSRVKGLYQQDMMTDVSGFFESGLRPLSLHHWKSWYFAPVDKMAAVTGLCGDCFLQRWRFSDDTVFTNGYSVAVYRDGVQNLDLDRMEGTWQDPDRAYDFSIGPLRPKMGSDEKKAYVLSDVEVLDTGAFRQVYVFRGDQDEDELDEVIELLWEG